MKKVIIILLIVTAIALVVIFTIRSFSSEDTWICQDGYWVKHGNPASDMPVATCK